ncbi:hypothetical protein M2171_002610 [Bradyrhizobium japonicum USDA 38]|uniref:hypothetical protein n=1 Tax=Bradyrhizobium japonicum TaxID=375 RepID=UPI000418B573|nr:hypothetical protein [Bradyrhizobium japonicum]MCS3893477.1 hypothetical protein [Bradyrhizobium japonicum USDA 38]MCS3945991.1 hypothetical protein [Bradyrhizobium japonicum]
MFGSNEDSQLDLFPPYKISEARYAVGRLIVRTLKDGSGMKTRAAWLCEYFGGRYVNREEGYSMSQVGAAKMEAAYAKGYDATFWELRDANRNPLPTSHDPRR